VCSGKMVVNNYYWQQRGNGKGQRNKQQIAQFAYTPSNEPLPEDDQKSKLGGYLNLFLLGFCCSAILCLTRCKKVNHVVSKVHAVLNKTCSFVSDMRHKLPEVPQHLNTLVRVVVSFVVKYEGA